jgi:hypothetical protein
VVANRADKRQQSVPKLLRMLPEERAYLDAAAAQAAASLRRTHPTAKFGLSNFIMGAALGEAERVLGKDLEQWKATDQRPSKRKDGR